jgi:NADPH-dependent 2,4-dienoyl-CoA reductase/sulfur reductase-like enzyme
VVVLVNRMGPLRLRWVAEHTAFDDRGEAGGTFVDVQREGPFRRWVHRHDVQAPRRAAVRRSSTRSNGSSRFRRSVVGSPERGPNAASAACSTSAIKQRATPWRLWAGSALVTASPKVIVVGGGLAGLSCALHLARRGIASTVLEASDRPGGRLRTDDVDGFLIDRGFRKCFSTPIRKHAMSST